MITQGPEVITMDDMTCAACGVDTLDVSVETYSLVRWNPDTQANELVAVYCAKHGKAIADALA
jgi:hypothetical protein